MSKLYWYTKVNKESNTKEKGSGEVVDLGMVGGNDIVYLIKELEKNNDKIIVYVETEKFSLRINSN